MPKKKPQSPQVRIIACEQLRLHETKRDTYYYMWRVKMLFDTREETQWYDIVLPKGSHLYNLIVEKQKLPRMVFVIREKDNTYPIRIGMSAQFRHASQIAYGDWGDAYVVSVTFERIPTLDYVDLLEKNP